MKTYDERFQDVSMRIKKYKNRKTTITTACLTLAVVLLATFLFVPYNTDPPSVSPYADSPYYDLIQKINAANFVPPSDANRFESVMSELQNAPGASMDGLNGGAVPEADAPSMDADYVEVTDNQVAGVTESDIIKRSTEYIYYLRFDELSVYSIAGEDSALVGTYPLEMKEEKTQEQYSYFENAEMYLSIDCTTITLVMDGYDSRIGSCTVLINLDVTDPENITETGRIYLSGSYLSSRMVDGDLLVMNKFRVRSDCDFNDESTFLPQIGQPEDMHSLAVEDILYPEELSSTQYTVICKLEGKTLAELDSAAFLSYSDEIYVSAENIFATRSYSESTEHGGSKSMTEISCLSYAGDTMEFKGSCTVEGSVKDQYSMDEFEGILRVVTSIRNTVASVDEFTASARLERNASLYCIDLSTMSILSSVEKFAPDNEQAESVRFDGVYGYVCTAEVITLTDPVYFFDLSDPMNITWTDTGTIDGYSSSLINMGDGFLLGIGFNGSMGLKIEVYEESADRVVSVCAYEANASFSAEYKSYLVDRDKDLIGLGVWDWNADSSDYILLHFDGYDINEVARIPMTGSLENMRAVLIDGYLYVFGNEFTVEKVL